MKNRPPKAKGSLIAGNLKSIKKDPIKFILDSSENLGDLFTYRIFNKTVYLLNHPDHIKQVLHTDHSNYRKSPGYAPLRLIGGNGIFMNDGEEWIRRRKYYQPAFSNSSIRSYVKNVVDNNQLLISEWSEKALNDEEVNVSVDMTKLAMGIISESLFSQRIDTDSEIWKNIHFSLNWAGERALRAPFVLPVNFPSKKNGKFKKAVQYLDKTIYQIIEEKRKQGKLESDLLSRLMDGNIEGLKKLSDQELRDEVMTIFLTGHETSAIGLIWCFYVLGKNKEYQDKIRNEINLLGSKKLDYDDMHSLIYTSQFVSEVLRLYPPVWHFGRMNLNDETVGGYTIPKESHIRVSPLAIHRHKDYWKDPLKFDPDRFSIENQKKQTPYTYIPFGAGPRLCVGRSFAMMEMVMTLALVLKEFELESNGEEIKAYPSMTYRPEKELLLKLKKIH